MLSYIAAESTFLRAFGNRSLLLLFLCILTRTGDMGGKASAFGISINLSQGLIVILGPVLALLFLVSLKMEADNLVIARNALLSEVRLTRTSRIPIAYILFASPTIFAGFLASQLFVNIVPLGEDCKTFDRFRYFYDFNTFQRGVPSQYCIRNIIEGMPWIYPPLQIYVSIGIVIICGVLSGMITRDWLKYR